MVGIYKKDIYFPEGKWKDYWTGEITNGSVEKHVPWPDDRGGALYIRSGAVIPFGPAMQYRGEKPMDKMTLYVFPDEKETDFNFYEDDGISFNYLKKEYSITRIVTKKNDSGCEIKIGRPEGKFDGMPTKRTWNLVVNVESQPSSISIGDKVLNQESFSYEKARKELTIKGIVAPATVQIASK